MLVLVAASTFNYNNIAYGFFMNSKIYLVLLFAISTIACSIGFSIDAPQKFSCETKDDCESGYECKSNVCEPEKPGVKDCPDEDGDGFGVGPERVNCPLCKTQSKCEEDLNDEDEFIYPGAPEECDGKDNDTDGTVDNIGTACQSTNDCASVNQTISPGVAILCNPDTNVCEARMRTTICFGAGAPDPCPCNNNILTCTAGAFPAVPDFCQ